MALGLGFIKRLGSNGQRQLSNDLVLKHTNDFELPADGTHSAATSPATSSIFSLRNAAQSFDSISSFRSIGRLGAVLQKAQPEKSSVMFDAEDLHADIGNEHSPAPLAPPAARAAPPVESKALNAQTHVAPARSGLTFLGRVSELGLHEAIQQEVRARQIQKGADLPDASKTGATLRSQDSQISNKGAHLSSTEIAENFKRNGSGLTAAQIALSYIDVSHDYIHANNAARGAKDVLGNQPSVVAAQELQTSRPSLDVRSHEGDRGR